MGEWLAGDRTGWSWSTSSIWRPCGGPRCGRSPPSGRGARRVLARRTDPATARALVALMDGICLQVLLTDAPYEAEYAREMLARIIGWSRVT